MHKIALQLGPITIHWYGVLVAAGILLGLWNSAKRGLSRALPQDKIIDAGIWIIVCGLIGARLFYIFMEWHSIFSKSPWWEVFMIHKGGLVYYGGFIGGTIGVILYCKFKKIDFWTFADILSPGIALAHIFGRFGCFMNGCCYGKQTDVFWAVRFPVSHETHNAGVHPTQLYEATLNLALFIWLSHYFKQNKFNGSVFACYLISYSLIRFIVEFFRGDYLPEQLFLSLTPGQVMSILLFISGILIWMFRRKFFTRSKPQN